MYPDLSYFFHDLFGTEPDNFMSLFKTYGLFLVMAIISAAIIFRHELKRKANEGLFKAQKVVRETGAPLKVSEILMNAFWGFVLGFKLPYAIQHYELLKQDAGAVILSGKGNWIAGIIVFAVILAYQLWNNQKLAQKNIKKEIREIYPHDRISTITFIAAVSGVVGAKVFAIVEDIPSFLADPLGTFFSGSGLTIYGGLIFGFLAVYWYLHKRAIPIRPVLDAVAPALLLGYAVGRLGCHFAGDGDWGIANTFTQPSWWFLPDWLWAYDYPHNIIQEGIPMDGCNYKYCHKLGEAVYPTAIYESLTSLLILALLWIIRKRLKIAGLLFFIYLIFNGIERYLIEIVRVNKRYDVGKGFDPTQAQVIAIGLIVVGIVGTLWLWREDKKRA